MNAIILAAGTSSRLVPLSYEKPKGLLEIKGEIIIERQIRQLREAGVTDITLVLGYKAEMFHYLIGKYNVNTVLNEDYYRYNNISSLVKVIDQIDNTFICCSDHYFSKNVFHEQPNVSYYAALYACGKTKEYCITSDGDDWITAVNIGGENSWYMAGHALFTHEFSERFRVLLMKTYALESMRSYYWEDVFIHHISELPMKVLRFPENEIWEFDTLDDLRKYDSNYWNDSKSAIIKHICAQKGCDEKDLYDFRPFPSKENEAFLFRKENSLFCYNRITDIIIELSQNSI